MEIKNYDNCSIASFVKLRNNKTHSGTVEWGKCKDICSLVCYRLC